MSGSLKDPSRPKPRSGSEPDGAFVLRDIDLGKPQADVVIVKLEASGMCHTNRPPVLAYAAACGFGT